MSKPTPSTVNVVCIKWGTLYGPEYVNRLAKGVRTHLSLNYRFVCFTDDTAGIDPSVECLPLPVLDLPKSHTDLRWHKVALFNSPLHDLEGESLFLDLDLVVVDSLDCFFEHPGKFCVVKDRDLFRKKWVDIFRPEHARRMAAVGNTSVYRWRIGDYSDLPVKLSASPEAVLSEFAMSQQYVTLTIASRGELVFWPKGWCVSFKNDCVARGLKSYFTTPKIPDGAKIVLFAGNLKQEDVINNRGSKWYRKIRPADWLTDAWN